jgi:hypothetical protein
VTHVVVVVVVRVQMFSTRADRDYFRTNTLLSSYIYRNVEGLNELYNNYRFPFESRRRNVSIQFFVHGITSDCLLSSSSSHSVGVPVVTQNVCDQNQKDPLATHRNNPLREFCSSNIKSDALLDLMVRFADFEKKTSGTEAACLYYGFTSRKLTLHNKDGVALGSFVRSFVRRCEGEFAG